MKLSYCTCSLLVGYTAVIPSLQVVHRSLFLSLVRGQGSSYKLSRPVTCTVMYMFLNCQGNRMKSIQLIDWLSTGKTFYSTSFICC